MRGADGSCLPETSPDCLLRPWSVMATTPRRGDCRVPNETVSVHATALLVCM